MLKVSKTRVRIPPGPLTIKRKEKKMIYLILALLFVALISYLTLKKLDKIKPEYDYKNPKLYNKYHHRVWIFENLFFFTIIFSCILLFISLVIWGSNNSAISNIQMTEQTIEESRKSSSAVERATLLQDLIKVNKRIKAVKYWNECWFTDSLISDEKVKEINYLK